MRLYIYKIDETILKGRVSARLRKLTKESELSKVALWKKLELVYKGRWGLFFT